MLQNLNRIVKIYSVFVLFYNGSQNSYNQDFIFFEHKMSNYTKIRSNCIL